MRRRGVRYRIAGLGAAGLLLALLAGCAAPAFVGPTTAQDQAASAHLVPGGLVTPDGQRLPARLIRPEAPDGSPLPVKAIIVAVHGFNDHSSAFDLPAPLWAAEGIATLAYDQRGFGTNPDRGIWAGADQMALDLAAALDAARTTFPGVPVYALGESMGGALVLNGFAGQTAARPKADGLILVAPAVWGRDTMPLINRLSLAIAARLFPGETFTGKGTGVQASDNIEMLRALGRDPFFIKATRVDAIYGLVNLMDGALAAAPAPLPPLLVLYGAHDQLIPADPMRRFMTHLAKDRADQQRLAFYPDGWHMLLRDLEGPLVAQDIAHWVRDPSAPLPSHADQAIARFLDGTAPTDPPPLTPKPLVHRNLDT